ncbi:putative XK-related protein 6 [Apostichopus japonicus]|uniref:XK-related protein n=1 Tax=Stichopus japonicus TaxID=307972 RepID=A0A2G8K1Z3_STIJA|nr:putative XK-related protein 6 [Apostichopus japonicus]
MGDSRKHSSNPDVGGPTSFSARTPPLQTSPTALTPPHDLEATSDDVFTTAAMPHDFKLNFSILDALFMLSGMFTYVADIVTDIVVAVQYLFDSDYLWAIMTFAFVLVPSVTLQYFSLRWFIIDISKEDWHKGKGFMAKLLSWAEWLLFHIFQLGAIKRYWRTLKYGWRSRDESDSHTKRMMNYRMMVYEYRDITMLRLLEAFMESAPQLVLQLYIIKKQYDAMEDIHWITGISALASLSSLAWGLEAYHKALRESRHDKRNIGYLGVGFRMMWRTFTISSRVISLALFASVYKWIIFPIVGGHWLLMTMWLIYQKTDFCNTSLEEWFFDGVIGIIYIFSFFNMKEGRTVYRAIIFYSVVFLENTLLFGFWYYSDDGIPSAKWYAIPAFILVWGGFFIGLFFMVSYYCCLHPNIEFPCHKKTVEGRTLQPWENRGMDEVDHSKQRDPLEGNLFTRGGRRSMQMFGEPLDDSRRSMQMFGEPLDVRIDTRSSCNEITPNSNHSNHVLSPPPHSHSNGKKLWHESQV